MVRGATGREPLPQNEPSMGVPTTSCGSVIHAFPQSLIQTQMEDLPWGRQRPRDFDEIVLTVKHFDALKTNLFTPTCLLTKKKKNV